MTPHSVVDSCPDKAFLVQGHTTFREPVRIRIGSDEQKEMADRVYHLFATRAVAPAHAFKIAFMTFKCGDFGVQNKDFRWKATHSGASARAPGQLSSSMCTSTPAGNRCLSEPIWRGGGPM